ncbi:hypothetical protein MHU86_19868 [Fragilaria crotonensis]|nr:hypothetical protein MHU86_19868 [Fragilaria crotonensis]
MTVSLLIFLTSHSILHHQGISLPARKQCQGESKEPPTLIHPSHPGLESEIATFTHRIASFGYTPTLTEFTGFLQHHEDLEDLVIIAIKMTGDEQLMPILDLLILVRSVIGQRNSHSVPPAHRMVDILAKFERIPTDGSREMTVQNFPSPPARIGGRRQLCSLANANYDVS